MNILDAFGGIKRILQIAAGVGIVFIGVIFIVAAGAAPAAAPLVKAVIGVTPEGKVANASADVVKAARDTA